MAGPGYGGAGATPTGKTDPNACNAATGIGQIQRGVYIAGTLVNGTCVPRVQKATPAASASSSAPVRAGMFGMPTWLVLGAAGVGLFFLLRRFSK